MEVATVFAPLIDPRFVVGLLLGPNPPDQDIPMGRLPGIAAIFCAALTLTLPAIASAQAAAPTTERAPTIAAKVTAEVLKGVWVRPDGGYTIAIRSVGPNGQLEALYFNPNQLPFAKAQSAQDGSVLRASFELQAGGYSGSTYELVYDAETDRLKGVYYQAVAKQKFEVYFVRKRQ